MTAYISRFFVRQILCSTEFKTNISFTYINGTRPELLSRPKVPKILKELLSDSEELKRFKKFLKDSKIFKKDSNCSSPKLTKGFQKILKDSKEFQKIPKNSKTLQRIQKDSKRLLKILKSSKNCKWISILHSKSLLELKKGLGA